ncbi:MAG: hypothetical protein AB8H03_28735 [Saprospiraceae bacterium]
MTQVKCSVLFERAELRAALETIRDKEGPKGLAFKIKGSAGVLTKNEKQEIDGTRISVVPVHFEDGTIKGSSSSVIVNKLIKTNGEDLQAGENAVWEYASLFDNEDFHFTFSFFDFDSLDVILNKIDSHYEGQIYNKVLLGSIKSEHGETKEENISAIHGNSFAFKLEPYVSKNEPPPEFMGFVDVNLGTPLFAIGLSCRTNWNKQPTTWMAEYIRASNENFFMALNNLP